uniref:Uncharacterized protein n=1 Tax=Arundo donax TaxID=35708 RepID=A0A0A8Z538_ARUDO
MLHFLPTKQEETRILPSICKILIQGIKH